jgi:hypothetical protein
MTGTDPKSRMLTDEEGRGIKAAAGRLAWNNVWQYHDGEGATVFVLESGPGRTLSLWHLDRLVESISEVLGPSRAFFIEGIEEVTLDTWTKMTPL